jgi:hypothetical protein
MTSFLFSRGIRIFDYPKFADPPRERVRQRAQEVCDANGVCIEHINMSHFRKEDLVARALAQRGNAPGLVHVISTMESYPKLQAGGTRATAMSCSALNGQEIEVAHPSRIIRPQLRLLRLLLHLLQVKLHEPHGPVTLSTSGQMSLSATRPGTLLRRAGFR